jgi:hypothetical protein
MDADTTPDTVMSELDEQQKRLLYGILRDAEQSADEKSVSVKHAALRAQWAYERDEIARIILVLGLRGAEATWR